MKLPVVTDDRRASAARLLTHFAHARAEFSAAGLDDPVVIGLGVAITAPQLARLYDANAIVDARVPQGTDVDAPWREAAEHFAQRGAPLLKVVFNPTAGNVETDPLRERLSRAGWSEHRRDVLRLERAAIGAGDIVTILSARAIDALYADFAAAVAAEVEPQLADVAMLRLNDPRFEALVALSAGRVVARATVLSLGEVGLIENVATHPDARRQGFGRAVMDRAIDLCARSQFRHVLLGCLASNEPAQRLYASLGFAKVGEHVEWLSPAAASRS